MQISTAGSLNNPWSTSGFSLVELIVVMFILSVLAFFTLPFFTRPGLFSGVQDQKSHKLAGVIASLKQKALNDGSTLILHLDLVEGKAWGTVETNEIENNQMDQEYKNGDVPIGKTQDNTEPAEYLSDFVFTKIELRNEPEDQNIEDIHIRFYPQGHSDIALIHMEEDDQIVTLKLQPFLPDVEIIQGDLSFNDCN